MKLDIGKSIQAGLKKKKWSQSQLSRKLKVCRQSVSQWVNNENKPRIETMRKLIGLLDLDERLLGAYGEMKAMRQQKKCQLSRRVDALEARVQKLEAKSKKR